MTKYNVDINKDGNAYTGVIVGGDPWGASPKTVTIDAVVIAQPSRIWDRLILSPSSAAELPRYLSPTFRWSYMVTKKSEAGYCQPAGTAVILGSVTAVGGMR
jgi:hypothetical protein